MYCVSSSDKADQIILLISTKKRNCARVVVASVTGVNGHNHIVIAMMTIVHVGCSKVVQTKRGHDLATEEQRVANAVKCEIQQDMKPKPKEKSEALKNRRVRKHVQIANGSRRIVWQHTRATHTRTHKVYVKKIKEKKNKKRRDREKNTTVYAYLPTANRPTRNQRSSKHDQSSSVCV